MGNITLKYIAGYNNFKNIRIGTPVLYYDKNRFDEHHWYSGIIKNHTSPPLCPPGTEGVFIKPTDNRVIRNQRISYDILQNSGSNYLIEIEQSFFKTELGAMRDYGSHYPNR